MSDDPKVSAEGEAALLDLGTMIAKTMMEAAAKAIAQRRIPKEAITAEVFLRLKEQLGIEAQSVVEAIASDTVREAVEQGTMKRLVNALIVAETVAAATRAVNTIFPKEATR